ncbi:DEAD/DEAH box helicase [Amycolatopsis sp. GM8]|uniref:DEAD/DEAH box helicase n=1 Tax=Amycolatopsis sp. GM8 TaxID=2896530 RepID=UPI001F1795F6|nr:DEAD/DEAH box helicase [Amycolatopsis sp. GM8]
MPGSPLTPAAVASTLFDFTLRPSQNQAVSAVVAGRDTLARLDRGELDFLFVGPEQLTNSETRDAIRAGAGDVGLFAIDEAHLVSEWGQEFRPAYLRLGDAITELGRPPVLALTATAAPPVQTDITRRLGMRSPEVVVSDFDRPNISLAMRQTQPRKREDQAVDDRCAPTSATRPCT